MVKDERLKRGKGGRPKKAIKRGITFGVRFTQTEFFVIKANAQKAGITVSYLIREMVINGKVNSRLSNEEREYVRQLIGMASNLNQVVKIAHKEGGLSALIMWEKYRNEIDEVLKKFQNDK